jgi:hypothetical protein
MTASSSKSPAPAPASISLFDMLPKEPMGFPLVAWIGGFVFFLILLMLFVL